MDKKIKNLSIAGFFIVSLAISYYLGCSLTYGRILEELQKNEEQRKTDISEKQSINKTLKSELLKFSEKFNGTLPVRSDNIEVKKITALGDELIILINVLDMNKITQNWLDINLKKKSISSVCSDSEMRYLLDKGAIFNYEFHDNLGDFGGTFTIRKADCL